MANISRKCSTNVRENRDIKSDLKIRVCPGVRPHPNDPIKGTNPPHKYWNWNFAKVSIWYGKQVGTKSDQNFWGVVHIRSLKPGCLWKTCHNRTIFVSLWYHSLESKEFLYCRWRTPWHKIWPENPSPYRCQTPLKWPK